MKKHTFVLSFLDNMLMSDDSRHKKVTTKLQKSLSMKVFLMTAVTNYIHNKTCHVFIICIHIKDIQKNVNSYLSGPKTDKTDNTLYKFV